MLMNKGVTPDGKRILSEKAVQELGAPNSPACPLNLFLKKSRARSLDWDAYIMGTGNSTVLLSPNMLGTTAWIDQCRKYAAILIVAKPKSRRR